jgi:hypothetical protein
VRAQIFIEGGGNSDRGLDDLLRAGFGKILEKAGFNGRMPRLVACGGRDEAFDQFKTAHSRGQFDYVALLVDAEDSVDDMEKPWEHLKRRDGWDKPAGATDDQVLLMATSMETWFVRDVETLRTYYRRGFQESALGPLPALPPAELEKRTRQEVFNCLQRATRDCSNAYAKGRRSFELLAEINPEALMPLPSFARMVRILNEKLQ